MSNDPLCLVPVPALVVLLKTAEDRKGSPLSEAEVVQIRDEATCIAVPLSATFALQDKRGYPDIVPEDCWKQWQRVRSSF